MAERGTLERQRFAIRREKARALAGLYLSDFCDRNARGVRRSLKARGFVCRHSADNLVVIAACQCRLQSG